MNDAGIGPACDFDAGKIVDHSEFMSEHRLERPDSSPLGIDQSAINVEE